MYKHCEVHRTSRNIGPPGPDSRASGLQVHCIFTYPYHMLCSFYGFTTLNYNTVLKQQLQHKSA